MSTETRKIVIPRHIDVEGDDGSVERHYAGEYILPAKTAATLTKRGAVYVDDDTYNDTITAKPKVDADPSTDTEAAVEIAAEVKAKGKK